MTREIKLSHIEDPLSELSYPLSRDDAVDRLDDVTLRLADGEANLGEVVADSNADSFDSADDLQNEVLNNLPREAVGEPGQSEGEG